MLDWAKEQRGEEFVSEQFQALIARRPTKLFDAVLSESKIADFRELGFTRIDRITTDEEVEWLRAVYDLLFSGDVKLLPGALVTDVMAARDEQRGDRIGQVLRPEWFIPELKETQFYRNSRALARQIAGGEAQLEVWGHMVRKAPGNSDVVPWHQDESYWDPSFDYGSSAYWMPLDPATRESGCMSFIPRSHKRGVLRHGFMKGDPHITALVLEEEIDTTTAVLQPVPIGGASIHHSRILHYSGPNTSDRVRRAYVNEWQVVPIKREVPYDRPWYWTKQKILRDLNKGPDRSPDGI